MDREELRGLLQSSYVLFSCEGTAEAVCIEKLVEAGSMVVPRHNIVDDPIYFTPYTRLRKADEIADRFLRTTFEGDGVSGLTICRVVDSRSARFKLPRRLEESCTVASLFTRPEIEMLVIHAVGTSGSPSRRRTSWARPVAPAPTTPPPARSRSKVTARGGRIGGDAAALLGRNW